MALINNDGLYIRVEHLRVGKKLMEFLVKVYYMEGEPEVQNDTTVVAPYDVNGANPFVQAYSYVRETMYPDAASDEPLKEATPVEEVVAETLDDQNALEFLDQLDRVINFDNVEDLIVEEPVEEPVQTPKPKTRRTRRTKK